MANWITSCEWCGKAMNFSTELKKRCWRKCEKCNDKAEKVVLKDCYPDIINSLKNGKWVIGKRETKWETGSGVDLDFVVFVLLTSKGNIRATYSRESVKDALNHLFSNQWTKEEINEFGFNSLEEMTPITNL